MGAYGDRNEPYVSVTQCVIPKVMFSLQFQSSTCADTYTDTYAEKLVESPTVFARSEFAQIDILFQNAALIQHQCQCQPWQLSGLIHLDFCHLRSFTIVRDQYQIWGIQFSGAIALQPSNAAFANQEQSVGLMPLMDRAPLTIQFEQPRQLVKADLVGAKQIIVRVFNQANQCVGEQYLGQPSFLASSGSDAPAHHEAQLWAAEITRMEIGSEAPFLMHRLICA